MLRVLGGGVVIAIIILALWSCTGRSKELSFAVTADEMLRDYRKDLTSAKLRYLDKTGKISGIIVQIEPRERGRVILHMRGREHIQGSVSCMFAGEKAVAGLGGLMAGQEITVIGKVLEYHPGYGIRMADCTLDLDIKRKVTLIPEPESEPVHEPELELEPDYEPQVVVIPAYEPDFGRPPDNTQTTIDDQTREAISSMVDDWTTAHNDKDFFLFSTLYSDKVNFYNKVYSNEVAVAEKQRLLNGKYADFYQEIYDLELMPDQGDRIRADFLKVVYSSGSSNTYQAYLIFDNQYGSWQIAKESDLTTDRHMRSK